MSVSASVFSQNYSDADNNTGASQWYQKTSGKVPVPTYEDERNLRNEYSKLFEAMPSPGDSIEVRLPTTPNIDDSPPTEEEVIWALKGMGRRKAPRASGIREENLRTWMEGATGDSPIHVKE